MVGLWLQIHPMVYVRGRFYQTLD